MDYEYHITYSSWIKSYYVIENDLINDIELKWNVKTLLNHEIMNDDEIKSFQNEDHLMSAKRSEIWLKQNHPEFLM